MKPVNANVLSAVDTSSQTGSTIDANQLIAASFQYIFADASANGTLKVQASNDITHPTNWDDVANGSATITVGGHGFISIDNLHYRWLRVVYTRVSGGSTTINVVMFAVSY